MFIVFYACLISAPDSCSEEYLRAPETILTSTACLIGAPPLLIEWERQHPDRRPRMDFRCVPEARLERRS